MNHHASTMSTASSDAYVDRARANMETMIKRRGYDHVHDTTFFSSQRGSSLTLFYCTLPKLNVDMLKIYIALLEERDVRHAIVIYKDAVTSSCRKVIESMTTFLFETFSFAEMQYDITTHCLYVPHAKVIPRPQQTKGYPILLKSDPICRYFAFERGDVIEVTRHSGIKAYRVVH